MGSISYKRKVCKSCLKPSYIWSHGRCKQCSLLSNDLPKKKKTPIPKVSKKRKKDMVKYSKLRLEYLRENEVCQGKLDGCTLNATTVHHMAGRVGDLYLDKNNWKALCMSCHEKVEMFPLMAKELGLSKSRLSNESQKS
jgi:hypothetical protein